MKVHAYLRCSTRKQDLDGQRRAVAEWAKREGHELVVHEDDHVSGRRADRDGIEELLAAVERGEVTRVAITELSRLGRSLGFVHRIIDMLTTKDIKLVLVSTGTVIDPTTMEGKALIGALSLASEIEWHLIQERNARGRATIKARGVRVGRKNAEVSEVALLALRSRGMTVREIATELKVSAATITRRLRALAARDGGDGSDAQPVGTSP